jgi:molecular chaperone GrpE
VTTTKKQVEKTELEKKLEAEIAKEQAVAEESDLKRQSPAAQEAPPAVDVAALTAERDALKEQLLRARADFDNYRKRMMRETERVRKTAAEALIADLLPVIDNLERALDHACDAPGGLGEGVEMVVNQLREVLARHGLQPIPAQGLPFDPNVHEAVMQVECAEMAPGHVAQVLQKGYRLGDYVLRPAKVAVSCGIPEPAESQGESE